MANLNLARLADGVADRVHDVRAIRRSTCRWRRAWNKQWAVGRRWRRQRGRRRGDLRHRGRPRRHAAEGVYSRHGGAVDSAQDLAAGSPAGFHIDQPIYGGGRHVADVRRNVALAVAATAGLQSLLDRVAHQVNLAYQAIATGQERIRLGEIAVSQARETCG